MKGRADLGHRDVFLRHEKGEERVHVTQNAPPLLEYQPAGAAQSMGNQSGEPHPSANEQLSEFGAKLKEQWLVIEEKILAFCQTQGWEAQPEQVRIACGFGAFLVIVLLYAIL